MESSKVRGKGSDIQQQKCSVNGHGFCLFDDISLGGVGNSSFVWSCFLRSILLPLRDGIVFFRLNSFKTGYHFFSGLPPPTNAAIEKAFNGDS